ncbi:MAG: patatin-like phospholipase family protein [Leptospiraceae bacterium]|nr:patatin-like phospholipase family protein [Leptospiraceae bacterium]
MFDYVASFLNLQPQHEVSFAIAGGGCKAFYGMGFGYQLKQWGIQFNGLSGVSAGAAMVIGLLSETEEETLEYIQSLVLRNESNFSFTRLLKGERPFPHENIYRRAIRYGTNFEKVKSSKVKIFIGAVGAFPKGDKLSGLFNKAKLISETATAFLLDESDKSKGIPCNRVEKIISKWNLRQVIYTNKDLEDPNIVEQIILNSSSIPPVLAFQNSGDIYFLDGGLMNNLLLEVFPIEAKKIAVCYDDYSIRSKEEKYLKNTLVFRPSRELKATTFDYTNPVAIEDAYTLGKEDAKANKDIILNFTEKKFSFPMVSTW